MDDDESNIESFKTEIFLDKLGRTVRYAKLRCLSPTEIFDRIAGLDLDPEVTDYVYRISELRLTGSNLEHLLGAMKNLANRSESSSSKVRAKIDRILLRLVRLLPTDIGNNFAEPFVDHRLKSRRRWAYSSLRQKPISKIIAVKLANVFKQHGESGLEISDLFPNLARHADDIAVLEKYDRLTAQTYCAPHCGACLSSCPEKLAINDVLRHRMYFEDYRSERQAIDLYAGLERNASVCAECSAPCLGSCPFGIRIQERMVGAHELLSVRPTVS